MMRYYRNMKKSLIIFLIVGLILISGCVKTPIRTDFEKELIEKYCTDNLVGLYKCPDGNYGVVPEGRYIPIEELPESSSFPFFTSEGITFVICHKSNGDWYWGGHGCDFEKCDFLDNLCPFNSDRKEKCGNNTCVADEWCNKIFKTCGPVPGACYDMGENKCYKLCKLDNECSDNLECSGLRICHGGDNCGDSPKVCH